MNAVQKLDVSEPTSLAPRMAVTPMEMLASAIDKGMAIETIDKLVALAERWDRNTARKAFDEAIASAKAEIPPIIKNRHVGFDSKKPGAARTDYRHEDMAEIARTVDPILAKYGLSYRFRATSNINEPITVTCILSHRQGHSEETTLTGGRDESGNKNSLQGIGSTITYLQRYSLKAALGLSASNDDDGKSADTGETLSDEQVDEISALLTETKSNLVAFLKTIKLESLTQIRADKFEDVKRFIRDTAAKRAAREAETAGAK
jgi:hypothetical protein